MKRALGRTVLIHEYVTGGGLAGQGLPASWAAEGGAMRRALAADFAAAGLRVVLTLDDRLSDDSGPWEVVRVGPGEERGWLADLAASADWTLVVAPEAGGLLRERAALVQSVGAISLGSTPEAVALAGDKLALADQLGALGIPTPPTLRIEAGTPLPRTFAYPAVLKPIDGAGSLDTWLVHAPEEDPRRGEPAAMVLQPQAPGEPISGSYLVGPDGRALLVGIGRQQVEIQGGRFHYRGGIVPFELPAADGWMRRALATVPGLRGWVGVDAVWDRETDALAVLEINPRPTTSIVGFRGLLPAGLPAAAWLALFDPAFGPLPADLAGRIAAARPLAFDADGTIRELEP